MTRRSTCGWTPARSFSAADLVNEWPEARIAQVLRRFGEERYAGGIAREIVRRRPLGTTSELVDAIKAGMPAAARFGGGHPAKRTFQAIRIAVNGELDALEEALPLAWGMLPVGGRLAAISFHSLEDRPVKRFLADRARGCVCPPELPVCVCGREPEAELLTRRAGRARPRGGRRNPRSQARPTCAPRSRSPRRGRGRPPDGRRRDRPQRPRRPRLAARRRASAAPQPARAARRRARTGARPARRPPAARQRAARRRRGAAGAPADPDRGRHRDRRPPACPTPA